MQFVKPIFKLWRPLFKLIILYVILFISSCEPKTNKASEHKMPCEFEFRFNAKMKNVLKPVEDPPVNINSLTLTEYVRYTYMLNNYSPVWIKNGEITESCQQFIEELEDTRWDGLNPEQYNLAGLKKLVQLFKYKKDSLNLAIALDTSFTHTYIDIAYTLLMGEVEPENADPIWYHINDTTWDAPTMLLNINNKYTSLNHFRSTLPTYNLARNEYIRYRALEKDTVIKNLISKIDTLISNRLFIDTDSASKIVALEIIKKKIPWILKKNESSVNKKDTRNLEMISDDTINEDTLSEEKHLIYGYQYFNGLNCTGKLDKSTLLSIATPLDSIAKKISANLERIRWMQRDFSKLYIMVDIPLMEFTLRQDCKELMHMRVVVGKPKRPTPSFFAFMSNIIINPTWGVPPTILKNDVLPGIIKSGKRYLAKKGLKVYDKNGKLVNTANINARNYRRFTYRQDAGDDNSLGYIKFNLKNPFDIYMHDTPHRGDFVKFYRALSSGCIRLQKPQELAIFILSQLEKIDFTAEKLSKKIQTHKTEYIGLKTKIPVYITYLTVFEDSTRNNLRLLNDVYKHDSLLISLLN